MFCKRMAAIHKKGKERLEDLREAYRAESERLIGVFGEVLAGAREATAPPGVDSDREALFWAQVEAGCGGVSGQSCGDELDHLTLANARCYGLPEHRERSSLRG